MRIVILSSGDIFTSRWANSFVELGYEVHLVVQEPFEEEFNTNVKIHLLPFRRPLGAILNVISFRKLLKKLNPDLLHVFGGSQPGLLGRLSGFHPGIVSVLGSDVFDFPYQSKLTHRIIVKNLKYFDWIGSTSIMMEKQVMRLYPSVKNITVTPFGVDTNQFKPLPDVKNNDYFTIGTVKTLRHKYGIDILIRSFADAYLRLIITNPIIAHKLRLLIVGGGSQLEELQNLTKELNIEKMVEFTGFVLNSKVPEYLNKLDIYVAMSRMKSESFGVAIVEASACSIPVIVSNIGGLPEVVLDGQTGFLIERDNINAVTEAMLKLIQDEELRKMMGKAGREFVQTKYEWSKCLDTMVEMHNQVLSKKIKTQ